MTWEAVTALSTAFTGVVIVATAIVGIGQIRQLRAQRRDAAAIELMRSLQDTTFAHAFRLLSSLAPGVKAEQLRAAGTDYEEAAQIAAFRFETLGMLVYRGTIAFDFVQDLVGGAIIEIWLRLEDTVRETREAKNWPMYCEWFQWLAEQYDKRGRLQQPPANLRHSNWEPPPT